MKDVRLCIDIQHGDYERILKMLRDAKLNFSTSLVIGLAQPELAVGSKMYFGTEEIENFVNSTYKIYLVISQGSGYDLIRKCKKKYEDSLVVVKTSKKGVLHMITKRGYYEGRSLILQVLNSKIC